MSTTIVFAFLILLLLHSLGTSISANDSSDILYDISPFIRVYTNGTIQRLIGTTVAPPLTDPITRVQSKDIVIHPKVNLTARLYLPGNADPAKKIPLLVYFHGGAFFTESAASPPYHRHLNSVVARANVVAVSVNYRLAPEHPLPVCYEDSWLALKWVFSHLKGYGRKEPWIKNYVDFRHVHVGGDSAGANIAHNMAIRAGSDHERGGVLLDGLFLNCPHFWGEKRIGFEEDASNISIKNMMESIWVHAYPNSRGLDDPLLNPALDPNLSRLGCRKVLVYVAGNDILRGRGWYYKQALRKSGWNGTVKVVLVKGEEHDFGVRFPDAPNAVQMMENFSAFLQV
ncbi:2-hydroxyisoflavanone dehydratase [Sesamum alatum]|uniref:2-hydroxyisoflavanone dehydratase n=1 Tax=Sesamum alatum TaxID=300844 RepID=A0AAE1YX34_9LAMI|nr:2-hydroxyisoflavanone dehydratase [Sesamum alatum]